jgi:replicative DNA helicase
MAATYNESVELCTLSCLFKDGSLYPTVEDVLSKKSFGWIPFGTVYQGIKDVVSNDLYPDVTTVATELDRRGLLDTVYIMSNNKRGREALEFIASMDVNVDNLESYSFQVSELYATRQLRDLKELIGQEIDSGKRPIEILSDIDLQTGKISAFIGSKSKNTTSARDAIRDSVDQFEDAVAGKDRYISTHLRFWDDYVNGLFPGRLYMIAANSNDGKTSLAINIANSVAIEQKIKTLYITMESGATEIINKFVQLDTGVSSLRIEKGKLSDSEMKLYGESANKIKEVGDCLIFDDSSELPLALLRTKIRKAVANGVKLVIIDQLEQILISGGGESQAEHIKFNYISYRIKAYAREMDVPIVLVHQTNKGADSGQNRGKDVDVQIGDINQGGQKACDAIAIIRHKKEGQEIISSFIHWVKNRQGPKKKVPVIFEGKRIKFKDMPEVIPSFVQGEIQSYVQL